MTIEHDLLKDILALDLSLVDTKVHHVVDEIVTVHITLQDEPDVLASCAWGLIFAIGVLSFHDARPRGISDRDFVPDDQYTISDMLRVLRYEHGCLNFHEDYIRGRCMKTTVEIDREGKILVETVNRGEAATRWVARLMEKKTIGVIEGGTA